MFKSITKNNQDSAFLRGKFWRVIQILYWIGIVLAAQAGFLIREHGYYGDNLVWPGFMLIMLSIPFYLLIKRIFSNAQALNTRLENMKSWRLIKVLYWLVVGIVILYFLFSEDYYNLGVLLLLGSVPLYGFITHLFSYINNGSKSKT